MVQGSCTEGVWLPAELHLLKIELESWCGMKRTTGLCLVSCLWMCGWAMVAQDATPAVIMPPPKVLLIEREMMKPGKSGAIHEKSELAFVNASKAANWQ